MSVYGLTKLMDELLMAGLDEGLLSLSHSNLLYMENPYSNKKHQ